MQRITIGGDRIGSGKKMQTDLHGFERSTHDMSYIWRSSMAPGCLVPFLVEFGLPGDTFDIKLRSEILTHPTIGPLFASYKAQYDVYEGPIRLYQGQLHNNKLGIGLKMGDVKLPGFVLWASKMPADVVDYDNAQINPSCLLKYLGISGVGYIPDNPGNPSMVIRAFNGVPLLLYWDIYKNYYANKQEEIGAVVHTPRTPLIQTVDQIEIGGTVLPEHPANGLGITVDLDSGVYMELTYTGAAPDLSQLQVKVDGQWYPILQFWQLGTTAGGTYFLNFIGSGPTTFTSWGYISASETPYLKPQVATFPLSNIDDMRERILAHATSSTEFSINTQELEPYSWLALPEAPADPSELPYKMPLEGLGLKTYQSDLFNNWLKTEWIDGPDSVTELTRIDTSAGYFTIDALNIAKKVYDLLNRIAISGGSYMDWLTATWDHKSFIGIESPVYHGGLSKELVFQEVISNSASQDQPLGTIAGRGVLSNKHKGGEIYIKVNEPSFIMGIVSLTPRIDYSQGNRWWNFMYTMDDFHKPNLDGIGFQELPTEYMAWWSTTQPVGSLGLWQIRSAGKQPAWIDYMTNVNRTYGNFAIDGNEMFMTLNRRYEPNANYSIKDLTTYIDPSKYNNIFAQTDITAQNFWVQIGVEMIVRRKMSAKIIPNL